MLELDYNGKWIFYFYKPLPSRPNKYYREKKKKTEETHQLTLRECIRCDGTMYVHITDYNVFVIAKCWWDERWRLMKAQKLKVDKGKSITFDGVNFICFIACVRSHNRSRNFYSFTCSVDVIVRPLCEKMYLHKNGW